MLEQPHGGHSLPTLGRILRLQWILVLVMVVAGLGLGGFYTSATERTYTSSATVLLNPLLDNPLSPEATSASGAQLTIALETEAEVAGSPVVAARVSDRLDRLVPADDESLSVEVPSGTQMVRVSFTSVTPKASAEAAQAFAEEFLDYRKARTTASKESSLKSLQGQFDETGKSLRQAVADAARDRGASVASRQVEMYANKLSLISEKISTTEYQASDPGRVLGPAEPPATANEVPMPVAIALGGIAGLLLGLGIAWYLEWRKDTVRADETLDVSGVPVLASIGPRDRLGSGRRSPAVREAFRRLRVGVVANTARPHVLAVASLDGSGSSAVAAQLAEAMSAAEYDVALLATDPRDRAFEATYDIPPEATGLSDLLTGAALDTADNVRSGMQIIPAGSEAETASELYAGQRLREVIDSLRHDHDYLIVAAAGAGTADGDAVISIADSLLIIVTPSHTTHPQVSAALERCHHLSVNVLGAISVMSPRRRSRRGDVEARLSTPLDHARSKLVT